MPEVEPVKEERERKPLTATLGDFSQLRGGERPLSPSLRGKCRIPGERHKEEVQPQHHSHAQNHQRQEPTQKRRRNRHKRRDRETTSQNAFEQGVSHMHVSNQQQADNTTPPAQSAPTAGGGDPTMNLALDAGRAITGVLQRAANGEPIFELPVRRLDWNGVAEFGMKTAIVAVAGVATVGAVKFIMGLGDGSVTEA